MERTAIVNNYKGYFIIREDLTIDIHIHDIVHDEQLAAANEKTVEGAIKFFEEFIAPKVKYNLEFEKMCLELRNAYIKDEIVQPDPKE